MNTPNQFFFQTQNVDDLKGCRVVSKNFKARGNLQLLFYIYLLNYFYNQLGES